MKRLVGENGVYLHALQSLAHVQETRLMTLTLRGIRALAYALEAKDAYTWGHSARVSRYAGAIARELALTHREIAIVSLGGELHDVGKIGVPEGLLRKPGPLTPGEYRQIMAHTVIGTRILNPLLHDYPEVMGIVRSHHERMDGTSLPDGLAGEEIPLAARIVAVADAFDAMTSARPYRSALSVGAALRELEQGAGSQFDEDCVLAAETLFHRDALSGTVGMEGFSAVIAHTGVGSAYQGSMLHS